MDATPTTAESLFLSHFLPLYPESARADLGLARATDANPGKNPALVDQLEDTALRFAALFPRLVEGAVLDFSDASVHRLSASLTRERREAWASDGGAAGAADNTLFNVVVHGAAYVAACIVKNHGGRWAVRNPLWESLVSLTSRAGTGDLPVFHWWLKALSDAALAGEANLSDRYRAQVELPCARPETWPRLFEGERSLPRITKVRYDVLHKYLKAHVPEVRDLGVVFPSPERFDELGFKWLDVRALGDNRVLLISGLARAGFHLFFLTASGFDKALYYPADSFPEPVVRPRGDKLEVHLAVGTQPVVHEMLYWGL
ncbi:MAG: hypothetical protein IPF92_26155 [Myxococcales bacterium]|nr:hypothetical protein [Myxococcales bacterium]MBL0194444.1 hypothetical protein [Myxococcales bacterium]HQY61852.1 hypothetical protein [Polyangiaceae bacterium]